MLEKIISMRDNLDSAKPLILSQNFFNFVKYLETNRTSAAFHF